MNDSLKNSIQQADAALARQGSDVEALVKQVKTKGESKKAANGMLLLLILAICVAIIAFRFPRIMEPYQWPDAGSEEVAEADLVAVVTAVQMYHTQHGKYPSQISEVELPGALVDMVHVHPITYEKRDDSFLIDWKLPKWHLKFDAQHNHMDVDRVK